MKKSRVNQKALAIATLSTAALWSTTSQAVHVNPGGLGQVLVFPYYTARAGYFTSLSVTNTQDNSKLLKVRFLESISGREVLDLHVFLAPFDTWTAGIVATADGARLIGNDNSCVTPSELFTETRSVNGRMVNEFRNDNYSGAMADPYFDYASLDRTREGYFEVLEMGVIDNDAIEGNALAGAAALVAGLMKPGGNGIPADCAALAAYEGQAGNAAIGFPNTGANLLAPPRGGLMGRASIIQSAIGANYTYDATALDGWSSRAAYARQGSGSPTLADAYPATSLVLLPSGVAAARWPDTADGARDAVSASLMRRDVVGEIVLDAGTASQTEWVVTFPTSRHYTKSSSGSSFQSENIVSAKLQAHNRENSNSGATSNGVQFLFFTASLLSAGFASVLGQPYYQLINLGGNRQMITEAYTTTGGAGVTPALQTGQGPNGNVRLAFDRERLTASSATLHRHDGMQNAIAGVHLGMPVVGFTVHNYQNSGVTSRYGGLIPLAMGANVN